MKLYKNYPYLFRKTNLHKISKGSRSIFLFKLYFASYDDPHGNFAKTILILKSLNNFTSSCSGSPFQRFSRILFSIFQLCFFAAGNFKNERGNEEMALDWLFNFGCFKQRDMKRINLNELEFNDFTPCAKTHFQCDF